MVARPDNYLSDESEDNSVKIRKIVACSCKTDYLCTTMRIPLVGPGQSVTPAAMVELVDTRDLKSLGQEWPCGFESRSRHFLFPPL